MPIITLTLSATAAVELVDTLCELGAWTTDNAYTSNEFAKRYLVDRLRHLVYDHRQREALAGVSTTEPDIVAS